MGKNTRWSADDLKKKGLVQNEKGDYVPVKSLVAKGKVEKIEPGKMITIKEVVKEYLSDPERQHKDLMLATGFAMQVQHQMAAGIDPIKNETGIEGYFGRVEKINQDYFLEKIKELSKFYSNTILEEKNFTLPDGERITVKHFFDINPCPAPRMTRSDQWKVDPFHKDPEKRQRPVITRYFAWRDAFRLMSSQKGYVLDERLHAVFVFPFPEYFSKKKRADLLHQPHKQRPDADNNAKSIMDCFGVDDGYVWDLRAVKIWGEKGQILIF